MADTDIISARIQNHLLQRLQSQDSAAKVSVKRTSLGWIKLRVITKIFRNQSLIQREERIDNLLLDIELNLGQYPISDYELLTPQEGESLEPEYIQLPLWSDILMAPEIEEPVLSMKDDPKRPQVVSFYSFKGGVGRSTALGMTAISLAKRNRRVVTIDFDLEAPGISVLFQPDIDPSNTEENGVLDYLYQRYLTPEENIPNIEDCIYKINFSGHGEIYLIPAGGYNENYIHRLAELDRRTWQSFYQGDRNPVSMLISDVNELLDPDVILIDARPGFNDISAIALFDLADTGIICFSPTDQSFEGLRYVVQAIRKQSNYRGKPDLRFLLTPMPTVSEEQSQTWIDKAENWIVENWGLPDEASIEELYSKVFYNPSIISLSSLLKTPREILNGYESVADFIDASLPDTLIESEVSSEEHRHVLDQLSFEAARAQDMESENIPDIFQRTADFPKFLSNKSWLIRGAKGTGKSLLFRLFVEQSEKAKNLARDDFGLSNFGFIAGHGEPRLNAPILNSTSLTSYEEQVGEDKWDVFWLNYTLLQLCSSQPQIHSVNALDEQLIKLSTEENPSQLSIIGWLVQRAQSPQSIPQASDELYIIDSLLSSRNCNVWILYDELDAGFGFGPENYARRRRSLEALLAWWLENGMSLKCIIPKIFLREDIWNQLNFINKGHYISRSLQLRWDEVDLWRLVLRQALQSSQILRDATEREFGVTVERLEMIEIEQLRKSLYPLWGERMGRGKKAYTYNWIRTRIADGNSNCFPRSLILLLQESVKREQEFSSTYSSKVILRPRALINAFPYVSKQRVDEVRNEYRELAELLDKMQGERSPIDENRLSEIWNIDESISPLRIKEMVDAGILKERSRPQDPPPRVYAVAELYLYGLGMVRKGQR
ncbi:P-loop ATPase, Sll1717 family [Synechococcus sp. PCC 7336]|uniref:tyrosine-protein kinase family protein n=1 Tax=Synechococcus sp. PCC 7336 TaxID=195250 RepID=UPI00034C892B|nr:AAA family ATPase [Synechococcus sp. PCC 7336]